MHQIGSFLRTAFIVLVAVCVTLFVVQNLAPMEINFLGWSLFAPRFVGVVIAFALGTCVGWIVGAWPRAKKTPPTSPPTSPPSEPSDQL